MNHQELENDLVIDRYLTGRLPPEQEARFEQHYLGCGQCLDQLEAAEGLRRGLHRAVAQDIVEIAVAQRVGWLSRLARSPGASIVAVAAIIAVAGLPVWLFYRNSELGEDLDRARSTIAEQTSQAESRERELAREREAGQELEELLAQQSGVPTFSLKRFRGSLLGDPEPAQTIILSRVERTLMLSLDLEPQAPGYYRIRLFDSSDREILRLDRLEVNPQGELVFSLVSTQLDAGDYVARVESATPGADPVPVARFSFRVVLQHARLVPGVPIPENQSPETPALTEEILKTPPLRLAGESGEFGADDGGSVCVVPVTHSEWAYG
ncbi:MAG: hypothetical protein GY719_34920 [bacterium]|nr:hypothetical protein [bacterium]